MAQGGCPVKVTAETGGMQPHAKESEIAGKPPKAGGEAWDGFPLGAPRRIQPCPHLDPRTSCLQNHDEADFWFLFFPVFVLNLFACVLCVLSCFSRDRLFTITPSVTLQAPPPMGFSRQEYRSGLPYLPLGHLPDPGIEPESPMAPAMQADSLLRSHWGTSGSI